MKAIFSKVYIFLIAVFILACALRLYQLSFFEFKNDQLQAIEMGNEVQKSHFLINHGLRSGIGIGNPPLFIWLMGLITSFTQNPLFISALFGIINIAALFLAMRYFNVTLPTKYAVLASVILAFSPAFTIYTNNIWGQCLLPILVILVYINLFYFIQGPQKAHNFIFLWVLVSLAAQLHMSGFFLFPVLLMVSLVYRKKIKITTYVFTTLLITIIFLPYLYHLFYEGEFAKFLSFSNLGQRSLYWKVFRDHIRLISFDFFRYYFRYDFGAVLNKSVGLARFILYPLSCLLIGLFVYGLFAYLHWLIKYRKLFDNREEVTKNYPLPFQISGFMLLVVTLGYLLLRIHTEPHYMIILFPAYAIVTAFVADSIWRFFWAKITISLSILSTLVLLVAVLVFIKNAGGHPHEYGPHYGKLLQWRQLIWDKLPIGACPDLAILGADKFNKEAMEALIMKGHNCTGRYVPVKLQVVWNDALMKYEYTIEALGQK